MINNQISPSFKEGMNICSTVNGYCKEHKGVPLYYYCFDCENDLICSECIIHGIHHDHNVMTIKKSIPILQNQL